MKVNWLNWREMGNKLKHSIFALVLSEIWGQDNGTGKLGLWNYWITPGPFWTDRTLISFHFLISCSFPLIRSTCWQIISSCEECRMCHVQKNSWPEIWQRWFIWCISILSLLTYFQMLEGRWNIGKQSTKFITLVVLTNL